MTRYIIENPLDGSQECVEDLTHYEGATILAEFEGELPDHHEIVDGEMVPILAEYKRIKWDKVKTLRQSKECGVCTTPVGPVQIDDASKTKIMGMLDTCRLCEEMNIPFSETFTLNNNENVVLDSTAVKQMSLAVSEYISQVYARGRELRTAIDDATTMAELEAIDIEANWP